MAEMISGLPLFRGRDNNDQLNQILRILGTPDDNTMKRLVNDSPEIQVRPFPRVPRVPFQNMFPKAHPLAIDLLDKLLKFDPPSASLPMKRFDTLTLPPQLPSLASHIHRAIASSIWAARRPSAGFLPAGRAWPARQLRLRVASLQRRVLGLSASSQSLPAVEHTALSP